MRYVPEHDVLTIDALGGVHIVVTDLSTGTETPATDLRRAVLATGGVPLREIVWRSVIIGRYQTNAVTGDGIFNRPETGLFGQIVELNRLHIAVTAHDTIIVLIANVEIKHPVSVMPVIHLTLQSTTVDTGVDITLLTKVISLINLIFANLPVGTHLEHLLAILRKGPSTDRLTITDTVGRAGIGRSQSG